MQAQRWINSVILNRFKMPILVRKALQKHLCRCLLASWNLDQNLGETYEYALKWKINLHRFRSSEGTLTSVSVYEPETIKLNTDHYFIEQYNRQRALQNHLCRCLLASWNLDENLGETYEYVLEIADRPSRLGLPEGTLTSVCVYDHETIKLNTDHYFIEQYHRQRAPSKAFMPLCTFKTNQLES